ncbi:hypothetical protein CAOG_03150 [Capsaspora owczarzaki ATCC 30864]|uniref:F-box domain-containing protein n=1 Tax=Capsaspora owczarzaki (strain ATCC 30864) TaxID=595528 RepID=A0A0D2VP28_CAPO3|nr:hypothetical protein CAOG_03150 [Capsaspora owczarzaki ATCC 30864]KJE92132.1 hypothetical protein CAOG_003150 [Capsaspora owczarzaki ATCC 30864]|eukprot:XP_004363989.1 hypothetical protein CAOG_03150 [Capsaspora owczarzaki ATCC 30864]
MWEDEGDYFDTPAFPDYPMVSEEIVFHIFVQLEPRDLCTLCRVNYVWKRLMLDPRLWNRLGQRYIAETAAMMQEYDTMYSPTDALERDITRGQKMIKSIKAYEQKLRARQRLTIIVPTSVRQRFFFPDFPDIRTSLVLKILSYLPPDQLSKCQLVCRTWRKFARDQSLWRAFHERETCHLNALKSQYDQLFSPPEELERAINASNQKLRSFSKRMNIGLREQIAKAESQPSARRLAIASGAIFPRCPRFSSNLFLYILSFLSAGDVARCMRVCSTWRALAESNSELWASVALNETELLRRLTITYESMYSPPESLEIAIRSKQKLVDSIRKLKRLLVLRNNALNKHSAFVQREGIAILPRAGAAALPLSLGAISAQPRSRVRTRADSSPSGRTDGSRKPSAPISE